MSDTALTKDFTTEAVLSVLTGRLLCDIGGIYEVLNWMTGESLYTHQLPRVGREAEPVILGMHPHLAEAVAEADQVNAENYAAWSAKWKARYGESIAIPRFNIAEHERIDPMSELAEKAHPDRIVVLDGSQREGQS
ncbi:DUF7736 domain-containing protein [Aminobacter aminovorans]|uniref:DUF7736 domain-containing protein n=1 Tax=Aminobacter aminovorans TaxID=83263 RepID=A0AAC8YNG9_AMIAI|nr:hypothetical protein [Aminobacter aminovorans]AMS41224.1 hypothetical protein AA2016_2296 [Aminobacter aminovorans]MBB3705793.1 hypothetical protein [Aminobacter aminovorans]